MAFPPEFLRELEDRSRIEEIAESYVRLRRAGKNLVGLCPFHSEKTPSFNVYPGNNSFYCFGCGKGGGDIMLVPKDREKDCAYIIEFKVHKPLKEKDLAKTVENALNQIEEKFYEAKLIADGFAPENIRKYGFAFKGKECLIGNGG